MQDSLNRAIEEVSSVDPLFALCVRLYTENRFLKDLLEQERTKVKYEAEQCQTHSIETTLSA